MNEQLYSKLGIDKGQNKEEILRILEEKQFECLERLDTVSDEVRKKELQEITQIIDSEITSLKDEIKAIRSSIILDENGNNDNKEEKKDKSVEEKKQEEERKAAVSDKVEKFKQKEEERKQKATETQGQDAQVQHNSLGTQPSSQNSVNTGTSSASQNAGNAGNAPQSHGNVQQGAAQGSNTVMPQRCSNNSVDFTKAINYYYAGDYSNAFKLFKEMSEKGDPSSCYMLSWMYNTGEGTRKDPERAFFWLKKSAEAGEPGARGTYGHLLINNPKSNKNDIKKGFKFLQKDAESGNDKAMMDYVNGCLVGKGGNSEIKRAIAFCDKLKEKSNDSFDKKKLDDIKEHLKKNKKTLSSKAVQPTATIGPNNQGQASYGYSYTAPLKKKVRWGRIIVTIVVISFILEGIGAVISSNMNRGSSTSSSVGQNKNSSTLTEKPNSKGKAIISVTEGNIRAGAGTDNTILQKGTKDEEYELTGNEQIVNNGVWYEIFLDSSNKKTGWVHESIVTVKKE